CRNCSTRRGLSLRQRGLLPWIAEGARVESALKESPTPLRDHFRPPVESKHAWDELHGGWPMVIVQQLYPILPAGYVAAPGVPGHDLRDRCLGLRTRRGEPRRKGDSWQWVCRRRPVGASEPNADAGNRLAGSG